MDMAAFAMDGTEEEGQEEGVGGDQGDAFTHPDLGDGSFGSQQLCTNTMAATRETERNHVQKNTR